MLEVRRTEHFLKKYEKICDAMLLLRIEKQIAKILENPEVGKPMRLARKGTREVYIPPFRLSYESSKDENRILFLDFYHKDEQ